RARPGEKSARHRLAEAAGRPAHGARPARRAGSSAAGRGASAGRRCLAASACARRDRRRLGGARARPPRAPLRAAARGRGGPPALSPAQPPSRRSAGGVGSAIARGLAAATGLLIQLTSKVFGEVGKRGGAAVADFRARPEHARWRAYALGSYGALVAGTLVA